MNEPTYNLGDRCRKCNSKNLNESFNPLTDTAEIVCESCDFSWSEEVDYEVLVDDKWILKSELKKYE